MRSKSDLLLLLEMLRRNESSGCCRCWSLVRRRTERGRVTGAGWRRRSWWRRRNSTSSSSPGLSSASWRPSLCLTLTLWWSNFRFKIDHEDLVVDYLNDFSDWESLHQEEEHQHVSEMRRQLWSARKVSFRPGRVACSSSFLQVNKFWFYIILHILRVK